MRSMVMLSKVFAPGSWDSSVEFSVGFSVEGAVLGWFSGLFWAREVCGMVEKIAPRANKKVREIARELVQNKKFERFMELSSRWHV